MAEPGRRSGIGLRVGKIAGLIVIGAAAVALGADQPPPSAAPTPAAKAGSTAAPAPQQTCVGSEVCRACHPDRFSTVERSSMGKIIMQFPRTDLEKRGCESCHGPRSLHVGDPTNPAYWQGLFGAHGAKATPARRDAVCNACHDKGDHLYWSGSLHDRSNLSCVTCHSVHAPASSRNLLTQPDEFQLCGGCHIVRRAQLMRTSHMPLRESKLTCSTCHNPHGTVLPHLVRGTSPNELCYRCHPERRGPFLWEHQPVRENCMSCHQPHGSIQDHLLTRKAERLCQACHIAPRHPGQPHGADTRFVFNRSCRNCHSQIHGSNHPSGRRLLR
jgi:DmsE family decaheme c-type cytochrome